MSEQIVDYNYTSLTFIQKKFLGLSNLFYRKKTDLEFYYSSRVKNRVQLNWDKIAVDSCPIVINNFNRVSTLKKSIEWMEKLEGKKSFIITDNNSTYPPLLDYYRQIDRLENVQVIYLKFNSWRRGAAYIGRLLGTRFEKYVITDADLEPYPNTPMDIIPKLFGLLDKYPSYNHVGLSLEINDLPKNMINEKVVNHESKFWPPIAEQLDEDCFDAPVDTTFAAYRNDSIVEEINYAIRTDRPYTLKHSDWYLDKNNIDDEYRYYLNTCQNCATWAKEIQLNPKK